MKIFFFIFGTPFFLAVLYVIRILFGLEYSVEYDEDFNPEYYAELTVEEEV